MMVKRASSKRSVRAMKVDFLFQKKTCNETKGKNRKSSIKEQFIALKKRATSEPKDYKSIQTAFSSIDLASENKECHFCNGASRKTRSHEDLRKRMQQNQTQNEIFEWLQEIYDISKTKLWEEKLVKLAENLMKPGAEERLKRKIKRYLKRVPSEFSDCDEEGKAFRDELPDTIVKKLKKLYFTNKSHDIKLYRVEVPSYLEYKDQDKKDKSIKSVVKHWLKCLPIKKRDFLGRTLKREEILSSIVQRLEPFIQHRPNSDRDYKCMLRSYIKQIIIEMPIDVSGNNKGDYLSQAVDNLVYSILDLEEEMKDKKGDTDKKKLNRDTIQDLYDSHNQNDNVEVNILLEKELKDFITDEITHFLEKADCVITRRRMAYIEMELTGIFIDTYKYIDNESYEIDDVKDKIILVLQDIGRFSEIHSESFANTLIRNFKAKFQDIEVNGTNFQHGSDSETVDTAFSETYTVYYNSSRHNLSKDSINSENEAEIKDNIQAYVDELSETIDSWLAKFQMQIPLVHKPSLRDIAVSKLTKNIVDRKKYLEEHPTKRISNVLETDRLRSHIFNWIRTLVGEDTTETIDHVPELLKKIQGIAVPVFNVSYVNQNNHISKLRVSPKKALTQNQSPQDMDYIEQLYVEILDWIDSIPYEEFNFGGRRYKKIKYIRELAENIHKGIKEGYDPDDVLDDEVDKWIKMVRKGKLRIYKIEELKERLVSIPFENSNKNDVAMQTANNIDNNKSVGVSEDSTGLNYDNYLRKVTKYVDEWLINILPNMHNDVTRKSAVKNLAEDIVDRHKYQELNPSCRGSYEDELENLKYQIFKSLNKIFGDDILQMVDHASELMLRLHTIFIDKSRNDYNLSNQIKAHNGVFKSSLRCGSTQKSVLNSNPYNRNNAKVGRNNVKFKDRFEKATSFRNEKYYGRHRSDFGLTYRNNDVQDHDEDVNFSGHPSKCKTYSQFYNNELLSNHSIINQPSDEMLRRNFSESHKGDPKNHISTPLIHTVTQSGSGVSTDRIRGIPDSKTGLIVRRKTEVYQVPSINKNGSRVSNKKHKLLEIKQEPPDEVADNSLTGLDLGQTYEHFDKIIKDSCEQLPLDLSTPEQRKLAEISRNGIYNVIWKTYFTLKSDPNTEYDYPLFETKLEDRLDLMLDCLPQTPEMKSVRASWKSNVILNLARMLRYVHSITNIPTFKQQLTEKFNRTFLRSHTKYLNDQIQHIFVMNAADAYIVYARYKTEDPVKATIYRQRLMKRLEELAEHVKMVRKEEFRNVNKNKLLQEAFKILGSVPLPNDETLKDEADVVLLGEEIEQWYCELPVKPIRSVLDDMLRNRLREILTKKLHDMEKRIDQDDTAFEREMKHEVSLFLQKDAELQDSEFININFMIDQLAHRLKNRKARLESYKTFEKGHLASSTFAQPNNEEALASLIDPDPQNYAEKCKYPGPVILGTSQIAGPSGGVHYSQVITDEEYPNILVADQGTQSYVPGYPAVSSRPGVTMIQNSVPGYPPSSSRLEMAMHYEPIHPPSTSRPERATTQSSVPSYPPSRSGLEMSVPQNYEPGYPPSNSREKVAPFGSPSEEFRTCQGFLNPSQPCGKIFAAGPEQRDVGIDDEEMLMRCSCLERLFKLRSRRRHCRGAIRSRLHSYHMMFPFGFPL